MNRNLMKYIKSLFKGVKQNGYKLKPCPKCKLRNEIILCKLAFPKVYKKKFVLCFDCNYETKRAFTVRGAKKNWNRRVTE